MPIHPQWLLGSPEKMACWVKENCKGQVLDIGAADRWIEKHLDASVQYIALDYPATGQNLYQAQPDLFGNASCLPFQDGSVDTVILLEVLEHLEEPRRALEEIQRVLKPGGTLLLSLPFLYPLHDAPYDFQRYTAFGLQRELEESGFIIEELDNTLSSSASAGLIAALAISGAMHKAFQKRQPSVILMPLLIAAIPLINLGAWVLEKVTPNWSNLSAGLRAKARTK
ncbi:MAG: methyltransferase domain-containing protein [Pseudomonadota bacterium]